MRRELLLGALKTDRIPDVVLVAQRNQVPVTEPNRAFEIGNKAEVVFVLEDSDGIGNRGRELTKNLPVRSVDRSSQTTSSSGNLVCC